MNRIRFCSKIKVLLEVSLVLLLSTGVHAGEMGPKASEKSFFSQVVDFFSFDKKEKPIDLLSDELEIPATCSGSQENIDQFSILRGYVHACRDLMQSDPSYVNFYQTKKCMQDISNSFKDITEQTCKDSLVTGLPGGMGDVYGVLLDGYLENVIITGDPGNENFNWDNGYDADADGVKDPGDPNFVPYVQHYFSLVGEWYSLTRGEIYKNLEGTPVMSQAQVDFLETRITKKFWDRLEETAQEWRDTFGQISISVKENKKNKVAQTEKLFQIFETLLQINRRVLDQALASELAVDIYDWGQSEALIGPSPALALIIGDVLSPFYERVRTLTKIYDIACKLKSCNDEFYDLNQTVWMLRFFDKLGQGEVIDDLGFDKSDTQPLTLFLVSVYDSGEVVKKMVGNLNTLFGVDNISYIEPGVDFPQFLEPFRKVFAESHDFVANYEATKSTAVDGTLKAGFFHGGNISQVNVGFGKVNMNQHITAVKSVNDQLQILSDSFVGKHNQLINNTLSINSSTIAMSELEDKINIDVTNILNLKSRIDSVREFIQGQRERFGETVKQVIANLGSSTETFGKKGGVVNITAESNSANAGSGTSFSTIGVVGDGPITLPDTLQKGDLLQITVSGDYDPTCAITARYGSEVSNAKAGPRGYALSFVNGKSKVRSTNNYTTDSTYESQGINVNACSGLPSIISGFFGVSTSVCANSSNGSRKERGTTTSDTASESTRSDASFDLGLTLPNTPYPTAPAGALLLVEMANGENNKWNFRSIKTLSSNNSIITRYGDSEGSKYYLVVNDCANSSGTESLNVTINQYRAEGTLAQEFIDKVTEMIPAIETKVAGLIENGVLSQQTLNVLRSEIEGSATGGLTLSSFTGNIRVLLQAFIDSEINVLDYKSQISNMERELENRKAQLNSLIDHFGEEGEQKNLKVSQRNWNLANMDLDFVNTEGTNRNLYTLNRVLRILDNSLVSYLDFRYDEGEKRAIVGNVSLLTRLNFASPFDDIALNMTTFMETLLDNLEDDLNNKPVTPKIMMGIHIPNPKYVKPIGFPDPTYDYPVMDEFRAKQFWDQIYEWRRGDGDQEIKFDMVYEDIYAQKGLACYVEAPVIDSFGMYFIPENEGYITDFNNMYRHRNAKFYLEGVSRVPFENNPRHYNFTNDDWRFMDSAVRMAKSPRDAANRLATEFPPSANVETGLGTGRSPFGYFQIGDIPAYSYKDQDDSDPDNDVMYLGDTPLDEIKELFIAYTFAASSNDFNVNLGWMNFCAPGGEYWKAPFRNVTFY